MAKMTVWPLSHWDTYNRDMLALSQPRSQGVAYTRGYLRVAGILDTGRRERMEWTLPSSLFPEAMTLDGAPIPVSLGVISWHPEFLVTASGAHPAAVVTIAPNNAVRVHAIPLDHAAGDIIGAVRATATGDVWYVGRTGGPSVAGLVIGRMRPGDGEFTYWRPALGFGHSRGLAVEDGGKAIWTTAILGLDDLRHALVRLDTDRNEFTAWALPAAEANVYNTALNQAREYGHVVVTPAEGGTRKVWWLMHSPRMEDRARLVSVDPVTGEARDHGPRTPHPPDPGRPVAVTLDAKFRPWLTFSDSALGGLTGPDCGEALHLKVRRWRVKPQRAIFQHRQVRVSPRVQPVLPVNHVPEAGGHDCFETLRFPPNTFPFTVTGSGVPLAQKSPLFASNGVDRIFQIAP